ncbi:MAG: hypothetical protein NTW46_02095 [Candidatus Nealsonbacteria bacterium]|nr:hypothetical protein [Candidatus Nealsonbacteria bacterium]
MPNFEKPPIPSFENDDFKYRKEEEPVLEKPEAEKEEEELEEAIGSQKTELKKEAEVKSKRFKGAGGFLGKAAIAIASIFTGGESKADEPALKPEKPAPEYKVPEPYKYVAPKYDYKVPAPYRQNPRGPASGERQQEKMEPIVTSKSLADLLGGRKEVKDLGNGKFAVYKGEKKYIEIDSECLKKIAELQAKYNYQYGRSRFKMRADAMKNMRADLKELIEREGIEVGIEDESPVKDIEPVKKTIKKEATKKPKINKSDYERDAGAYDHFDK